MKAIFYFDLKKELKSVRAIIVGILFILIAYLIATFSQSLAIFSNGRSPAIEILFGLYAFGVFLFSAVLFSSIITREVQTQTFRYVTPYVSRRKIYITKFLMMMAFFTVITLVSLLVLLTLRGEFYFPIQSIFNLLVFYAYTEALVLLISTLSNNERLSSLLGISLSFIAPILYGIVYFKDNTFLNWINWLLPYRYLDLGSTWEISILVVLSIGMLCLGMYIFDRKEL